MRPLRTFTIQPSLPPELQGLLEIAYNLRWSWTGEAQDLFRRLDIKGWEEHYHNPIAMLGRIDQQRLREVAADEGFLAHLHRVHEDLKDYLTRPGWWQKTYQTGRQPLVAYFCAEFGISECLPIYSGGLGVLAGDHLKSASEIDVPLIGVGLLYQQGYFRQRLNADGWQLELFPRNDFANLPVQLVRGDDNAPVTINVEMPDRLTKAQIWKVQVGRITLYLMDTNVPENNPEDRHITAQLYGGDQEMRIRQEIILGIGGVRLLRAMGIVPKAYHMNEGHSAFLGLERIRLLMAEQGVSFDEAREVVAASSIFTTHTPVPAGNDAFEPWLIDKYFSRYWPQLGLSREQFLSLGRQEPGNRDEPMSLTVLAMRLSTFRNGVSKLHSEVSRKLWAGTWPGVPVDEIPISGITNGIHVRTWISHDQAQLYDRYMGPDWQEKPVSTNVWQGVYEIPDTELWRTHERRRERLVAFARRRLGLQLARRGASTAELAAAQEALDPEALTIGFARRFATYKRANLILSDLERLEKLLSQADRPVQILFAGKAHPRDNPGKDLIRQIIHTARKDAFRHSIVFLEDYDMNMARYFVQGVDVWLNTPLRPMEASGTSGMKAAANGALNISILDGWWDEGYEGQVGWAIGSGETYDDLEYQNAVESQALYDLLEKEVVPLFYERGSDHLPRGWIARMKATIATLAPVFNTNRMVRQYAEMFYEPASRRWDLLTGQDLARAKELAHWKAQVRDRFGSIRIESVSDDMDSNGTGARVGKDIQVQAVVDVAQLDPRDVQVELYYGPLNEDGQLNEGRAIPMEQVSQDGSKVHYSVNMPCARSGMTGYTVRILPRHELLTDPRELAMIRWA
ncbi:MAG: Maltodextrin phosphorylase [Planctomycetes bacterium ADurb.Bin126]|nr:MAG: Maltodextrin phosphorylase [Planctomycetes bacterium ADurb.Bin126]HQL75733.1 alpha-glucan family phosphorylase [Phycisphaerae bacterium]